jgi:serine/threonine-protein kinase
VKRAADQALELIPDLADAHVALGYYYYHGHLDYQHALEQFAIAMQRQPNNADVWAAVGYVQRRQGKWEDALTSLGKAAELDPRSNVNAEELGETYLALGRYAEAERTLDRAQSLAPDMAYNCVYRAWAVLAGSGDVEGARRVLAAGATHQPMSEVLRDAGIFGGALIRMMDARYQGLILGLPLQTFGADSAKYYLEKALVHSARHETQLMRAYYDSIRIFAETQVRNQPDDPFPHMALGIAYAGLGRKDGAIREGMRAVALRPISLDAYSGPVMVTRLAEIYVMVGDYDAAIGQLEIVLPLPSDMKVTVALLRVDPVWAPLRGNPRFERLLSP